MSDPEEDRRKILRVVEVDPQRLTAMDAEIGELRLEQVKLKLDADTRGKTLDRVEASVGKLDDAIRGNNGQPGLNQTVGHMRARLDELLNKLQDTSDFAMRLNTGKFRTLARDEIEKSAAVIRAIAAEEAVKALGAPGGWSEFRKSWLFPIVLSIVIGLVGAWIGANFSP